MTKRLLESQDLLSLRLLDNPQWHPDGSFIVLEETRPDPETNGYRSRLTRLDPYALGEDGFAALTPWTAPPGGKRDRHVRFSPSGELMGFLSNRSGSNQLWVIPVSGGEATQLTEIPGLRNFAWGADDRTLVVEVMTDLQADAGGEAVTGPDEGRLSELRRQHTAGIRVVDHLVYKMDAIGFTDGRYPHLYRLTLPPTSEEAVGSEALVRLTGEARSDNRHPTLSPDGRQVAFLARRGEDFESKPFGRSLYTVPVAGGEIRTLVDDGSGVDHPSWSPDGKQIAFLRTAFDDDGSVGNVEVWTVPADGSEPARPLTSGFDRSLIDASISDLRAAGRDGSLHWSADGGTIYALCSDWGTTYLSAIDVASGAVRHVSPEGLTLTLLSWKPGGTEVVALGSESSTPVDLWIGDVADVGGDDRTDGVVNLRRLTNSNPWLADIDIGVPEEFVFRASDDSPEVQGWLLRPPGNSAAGDDLAPVIVSVHGGPPFMYTAGFMFDFQVLRAQGFAIAYSNPRYSEGYGRAFRDVDRKIMGTVDYDDVMALTDAVLERGGLDPERVGITGGSYGGFMTNWAIGHTQRFRAAVSERSVTNWFSMFGTGDNAFARAEGLGGYPWDATDVYLGISPMMHVGNINTPLLLMHAEQDLRCPIEQAEQLYTALKVLGRTVQLVRYPDENHDMSRSGRPWNRIDRMDRIVDWFDRYLKGAPPLD